MFKKTLEFRIVTLAPQSYLGGASTILVLKKIKLLNYSSNIYSIFTRKKIQGKITLPGEGHAALGFSLPFLNSALN